MSAQEDGSTPPLNLGKSAKPTRVSLVQKATERFETRSDQHVAPPAPALNTQADAYRQRARERLHLLQGSGLALAPTKHANTIAFTPLRSTAAGAQQRPQLWKYFAVIVCTAAITAGLLHQINAGAIFTSPAHQTFAGTVSMKPTPPSAALSPMPSPHVASMEQAEPGQGISLQLSTQLTLPAGQK